MGNLDTRGWVDTLGRILPVYNYTDSGWLELEFRAEATQISFRYFIYFHPNCAKNS